MMRINFICIVSIFFFSKSYTQNNIFLSRDYWKLNPSIDKIKNDILNGNDPTQMNFYGFDAVVYSLLENVNYPSIKYLLEIEGNELEKKTHDSRTYIFWAAYKANLKIMDYLLRKDVQTNIYDSNGNNPITFAASTGQKNIEVYNLFEKYGSILTDEINRDGANILLLICPFLEDYKEIEYFTSKGFSIEDKDLKGNNIFNYSSKKGNISFLKKLVEKGVNPKITSKDGWNAISFACQGTRNHSNSLNTFKYLESLGIEVNFTLKNGFTPIHLLVNKYKDPDIFNYFIKKGVDVNQQDINGNTAFINAAFKNDIKIIDLLFKSVDNINLSNKKGITALMSAVQNNSPSVVSYLLENGSDPFLKDIYDNNIAFYLIESFKRENLEQFNNKVTLLNTYGFEIDDTPQGGGNSLIHITAKKMDLDLVKWLMQYKLNINQKNEEGNTALHIVAMKAKNDKILKFLIRNGANKEIKTDFNESAMDLALENELLLKNKINLNFLK